MKIRDYRDEFITTLEPLYGVHEAESFFSMLLEHFHKMRRVDLAMKPDLEFASDDIQKWNSAREKLLLEIPIQYIIGKAHFFGLEFEVNPNVLIPRPETEELVQWILSQSDLDKIKPKILDIGTGSGCIAISLSKNLPNAQVEAIDVSEKALTTAMRNAEINQVRVKILQMDILQAGNLDLQYDVIVSNPPYVRMLEQTEIKKNVLESEPHLALFVSDDDALVFYRKIAELAMKNLSNEGFLFFEINQYLGNEMVELLQNKGFSRVELRQDIYGNDRMILARK